MTTIADIVTVNVSIADTVLSRAGFGTMLALADIENTVFTPRTKAYADITAIEVDFANTLDIHKLATAFFAISPRPATFKVGRQEAGDADVSAALAAIVAEDDDWYALALTNHVELDLLQAETFISTRQKIMGAGSQDATLKAAQSTASITGITRVGQVATAIAAGAHSLANGDLVKVTGANETEYNGTFVIFNITATDFDYTITGAPDTPATGTILWEAGAVDDVWATAAATRVFMLWHHASDSAYPEAAWFARQLPKDPGASTWNFKQLTGIAGSDIVQVTPAEEAFLLAKNSNVYAFIGSTGVAATREGTMASGRFIDVQRSQDWLQARIGEGILLRLLNEPKVPYTDKGAGVIRGEIVKVLQEAINFGMLGPLLDVDDGAFFDITIPKVAAQSANDRTARNFPGIIVTAQLAGAIHQTTVNVNVSV